MFNFAFGGLDLKKDYYSDTDLKDEFYDQLLGVNALSIAEIEWLIDICKRKVKMHNVRERLDMKIGTRVIQSKMANVKSVVLFTDASEHSFGFGMIWDQTKYSVAYNFPQFMIENWSINAKELYAVMWAIIFGIKWAKVYKIGSCNFTIYIDNIAAGAIASTAKVSLRSLELALCLKVIHACTLAFPHLGLWFQYIATDDNK